MNTVYSLAASVPKMCARRLSTTGVRSCVKADLTKIKRAQMEIQKNEDVPMYIRKGPVDQFLYFTALGLLALSLGMALNSTYRLITKK